MGKEVVSQLLSQGKQVVALVRSDEAAAELNAMGANAIIGDAFTYKVLQTRHEHTHASTTQRTGSPGCMCDVVLCHGRWVMSTGC